MLYLYGGECFNLWQIVKSVVLFPPPFYFVFDISDLLSYIQNNFKFFFLVATVVIIAFILITINYIILPARASEQGNVIGLVSIYICIVVIKKNCK